MNANRLISMILRMIFRNMGRKGLGGEKPTGAQRKAARRAKQSIRIARRMGKM